VLTLGVILYITIHILIYTYTIIYYTYTILQFSSLLLFSSSPLSSHLSSSFPTILPSYIHSILVGTYIYLFIFFHPHLLISPLLPNHWIPIFILYLSVLTYGYLYYSDPLPPNNSTPHKLSEGCLEWWMVISIGLCF
jgi:hypothetical protein